MLSERMAFGGTGGGWSFSACFAESDAYEWLILLVSDPGLGGLEGSVGDGGRWRFMLTAGSWLILPFSSAFEGCNTGLIGGGFLFGRLEPCVKTSDVIGFCTKGEEDLAFSGSVVTLLIGEALRSLGEFEFPKRAFDKGSGGELDPAIDDGLDCETPPKYPDCIARMPKRSPSSISRMFSSCLSSRAPDASWLAAATCFRSL